MKESFIERDRRSREGQESLARLARGERTGPQPVIEDAPLQESYDNSEIHANTQSDVPSHEAPQAVPSYPGMTTIYDMQGHATKAVVNNLDLVNPDQAQRIRARRAQQEQLRVQTESLLQTVQLLRQLGWQPPHATAQQQGNPEYHQGYAAPQSAIEPTPTRPELSAGPTHRNTGLTQMPELPAGHQPVQEDFSPVAERNPIYKNPRYVAAAAAGVLAVSLAGGALANRSSEPGLAAMLNVSSGSDLALNALSCDEPAFVVDGSYAAPVEVLYQQADPAEAREKDKNNNYSLNTTEALVPPMIDAAQSPVPAGIGAEYLVEGTERLPLVAANGQWEIAVCDTNGDAIVAGSRKATVIPENLEFYLVGQANGAFPNPAGFRTLEQITSFGPRDPEDPKKINPENLATFPMTVEEMNKVTKRLQDADGAGNTVAENVVAARALDGAQQQRTTEVQAAILGPIETAIQQQAAAAGKDSYRVVVDGGMPLISTQILGRLAEIERERDGISIDTSKEVVQIRSVDVAERAVVNQITEEPTTQPSATPSAEPTTGEQ